MAEPYDALAEASRKITSAFEREKDRYIELQKANRKLEATNKELLEALEELDASTETVVEIEGVEIRYADSSVMQQVRAAIAKARQS